MTNMRIRVPDDQEAGAYANLLGVWHSASEFTLDFAVTLPAEKDAAGSLSVPARVVSRVKVPPVMVFDIMKTIGDSLTKYEATFGTIRKPGDDQPMLIPDELLAEDDQGEGDASDDDD